MVALDSFYPMTGVTEQLAQWQKFAPNYHGDGVLAGTLNSFSAAQHAPPGMSVDVNTGQCFIQGVFGESGTSKTVTIAAADATNPRIDRIVLRCDTVAQDLELIVITGTPAGSPTAPALVRSATQTDLSLYQVLVGTTVSTIVSANLTDERQYSSPRGIPFARTIASSGTINPFGVLPLTEGHVWCQVSGTTTISNIAPGNTPPASFSGQILFMEFLSAGCTVTSGGNIVLSRDFISGVAHSQLVLFWDATQWVEWSRNGEQAPAHQYFGNPTGAATAATFAGLTTTDFVASVFWSTWSPTTTQGSAPTTTQTCYRVCTMGKLVIVEYYTKFTSAGTANTAILVTLPAALNFAATIFAGQHLGSGQFKSAATPLYYGLSVIANATTQLAFVADSSSGALAQGLLGTTLGGGPTIANNDTMSFVLSYETV